MGDQISTKTIRKNLIEVYGKIGDFEIPNQDIKVKYFSTSASPRDNTTGEFLLLNELKPMRERVNPKDLKDLNSILQRDLNDARVANELVPYLKGDKSEITFFPAILAVLIPKEFIQGSSGDYPKFERLETEGENPKVKFNDCWEVEIFTSKDDKGEISELPLGVMSINPNKTEIIVLDGQHRSNAFRYVSGLLDDQRDIHSAFYDKQEPLKDFPAELPVTLIWFESIDKTIDPNLISRNLFVDVNNSAKKVSKSRNILLDDKNLTSLMTRFFYTSLASSKSFAADKFSLLHSGFDLDSDISSKAGNKLTLINPEMMDYLLSWLFFSTTTYDSIDVYEVKREMPRIHSNEFSRTFDDIKFDRNKFHKNSSNEIVINNSTYIKEFETEFKKKADIFLREVFEGFCLYEEHYNACGMLENWIYDEQSSPTVVDVWEDVFCGGEGLYYTLNNSSNVVSENKDLKAFRKAIQNIENKFSELRRGQFNKSLEGKVDQAYSHMLTKAFTVGIFMALKKFRDILGAEKYTSIFEEFVSRLNDKSKNDWIIIFTDIKKEIESSMSPKKWPVYKNLIIRVIQEEKKVYNESNFDDSPEGQIFQGKVQKKLSSWIEVEEKDVLALKLSDIKSITKKAWYEEAMKEIINLFESANIKCINPVDLVAAGDNVIANELKKYQ